MVRALAMVEERGTLTARRGSGRTITAPYPTRLTSEPLDAGLPAPALQQIDLRSSQMPPAEGIADAMREATEATLDLLAPGGYNTTGIPELREAIADHYKARGLPTAADQVLVTTGAVNAVHLAAATLTRPGSHVLVENPTYPNTARALQSTGVRCLPVDVEADHGGRMLAQSILRAGAGCALLTPDFQNPTGRLMTADGRSQILQAARRHDVALIVDETLVATNWRQLPMPPPLAGRGITTALVGSMSKSHWAGLRIGWIRASRPLIDRISHQRLGVDLGASLQAQVLAAHLLRQPLPQHRWNDVATKHDLLLTELRNHLPSWHIPAADGGLNLWCHLPTETCEQVVTAAAAQGLLLASGHVFSSAGYGWGARLRLPFTARSKHLRQAVAILTDITS